MSIPDNLTPIENPFKNIDLDKIKQSISNYQPEIEIPIAPSVNVPPNPVYETNEILVEQNEKIDELSNKLENANSEISKQTKELQSIHYENMKLNAQINLLNKTIDFQNDELERLRNINTELKITNQTLENSNRHSTRNAILLAIGTGVVLIAIEHWHDIYTFILHLIE